ncbi:phosphoadenosine phosphosulfate reductase family protein [Silvimonas soli]|uniref:phosphoadenosine phosphosulfate reductase family protein n=1 Tax=Silvimonas soli TaxID=2980100 RepID=UPI0024B3C8A3|nr:phosphoadenosine phosphosulfate reductase family protein [Silvimonas soli]
MEHNVISVSGGKDSTALLLLALERQPENLQAVFADTGNEHPQTYDYVRYLSEVTGVPIRWVKADFSRQMEGKRKFVAEKWPAMDVPDDQVQRALAVLQPTGNPFLDLCIWKGRFPSSQAAFCSEELKRNPIQKQVQNPLLDAGDDVMSWQGVRADESPRRALLTELEFVRKSGAGGELWNVRPILRWTADECFAMHRKHGVEHNPLYEQGMGRVGCMPCINCRKDELLAISKRFPEEISRIAEWEQIVSQASKRGSSTFFAAANLGITDNDSSVLDQANVHKFVEWAQTSRGGKQFDAFRVLDDGPLCSSIYGLCE